MHSSIHSSIHLVLSNPLQFNIIRSYFVFSCDLVHHQSMCQLSICLYLSICLSFLSVFRNPIYIRIFVVLKAFYTTKQGPIEGNRGLKPSQTSTVTTPISLCLSLSLSTSIIPLSMISMYSLLCFCLLCQSTLCLLLRARA